MNAREPPESVFLENTVSTLYTKIHDLVNTYGREKSSQVGSTNKLQ